MSHGRPAPGIPDLRGPALARGAADYGSRVTPEALLEQAVAAGVECDLRAVEDAAVPAELVGRLLAGSAVRGVRLRGARITGPFDLEGRRLGELRLLECEVEEELWLRGAALPLLDLRRCRLVGMSLTEATVDRVVLLDGMRSTGTVYLGAARLGTACSLRRVRLDGGTRQALVADRIRLSGELILDDLEAAGGGPNGTVDLVGARIDGRISARRIRVTNAAGPALTADNLQVTDTFDLSHGAELSGAGPRGAVRLVGTRAGSISLGGATLTNTSGWSLAAHYLGLVGTLYLDQVVATGGLRLSGGTIGGQIDLTGSQVDGLGGRALAGTRLHVAQAMVLDDASFRSAGAEPTIDLRSARVAGDLNMRHTRLHHPGELALRVNTATVEGRLVLDGLVVERGGIDLRSSTVGELHDDPIALPDEDGWLELTGLTYRGVPGAGKVSIAQRIAWLRRMSEYAAQPYRQLAASYQAAGHPEEVRRILVAQQEHLRASGELTGWAATRHRLSGALVQYGYQPLRAVVALAAVLFVAILLFLGLAGGTERKVEPPEKPVRCVAVDRVGLAIDAAIPLATTGADDRCTLATKARSGQVLAATSWALTLAGWASATLVVAGYTGLVRKS